MHIITISDKNWLRELSQQIRNATSGATLAVSSETKKLLTERAIKRMGREDLSVIVMNNQEDDEQ